MGHERVTAQSLKVVLVDAERNLLGVQVPSPGQRRPGHDPGRAQAVGADDGSMGTMKVDVFNMKGEKVKRWSCRPRSSKPQ